MNKKKQEPMQPSNNGGRKPESLFKHFQYEERRPGSHDYRKIPSMMGGVRVYRYGNEEQGGNGNN